MLRASRVLSVLCALAVAGCATVPARFVAQTPTPLPPGLAAYYDYPDHAPKAAVEPVKRRRAWTESLVRFPLSVPEGLTPTEPTVEFEWFETTQPGRRAAIVFHPILGGDYPLERGVCRYLAQQGFHVALVHRKTLKIPPEREVAYLELLLRQGVLRIRQVVDWMARQERVDPDRLGSFGISMGGIATVLAAAVEPRLRAHVAALPGGGIADILASSNDSLLTKPLNKYLAHHRMNKKTLEQQLRAALKTDPILLAPYVPTDRFLMFIAVADRTIGYRNSMRLWEALGRPKSVLLPFGHYTAYLALPYLKYASRRFFQKALSVDEQTAYN